MSEGEGVKSVSASAGEHGLRINKSENASATPAPNVSTTPSTAPSLAPHGAVTSQDSPTLTSPSLATNDAAKKVSGDAETPAACQNKGGSGSNREPGAPATATAVTAAAAAAAGLPPSGRSVSMPMEGSGPVHRFWDKQPVPKLNSSAPTRCAPLQVRQVSDVRKEPYPLPAGFRWVTMDVMNDEKDTSDLYELLRNNYVEDDDSFFRFDYSVETLRWALSPPGFHTNWHVGLRFTPVVDSGAVESGAVVEKRTDVSESVDKKECEKGEGVEGIEGIEGLEGDGKEEKVAEGQKGELMAFISAVPVTVKIYDDAKPMAEVNFLCVHRKLRSKRLAPVMIMEITRRVNLLNIWQAVYTTGITLPRPVAECRYFHRFLNYPKLVSTGFCSPPYLSTVESMAALYRLRSETLLPQVRPFKREDLPKVTRLFNDFQKARDLKLYPLKSEEEVAHWLLSRDRVLHSFVVTHPVDDEKITDFFSFYTLPSLVIRHAQKYDHLNVAYCYYYAHTRLTVVQLIEQAIIYAKKL